MEAFERRKIQNAIECIDICTRELMYQVLNNIDAHIATTDEGEKKAVKVFIKNPIMNSVNRLQAHKSNLVKLIADSGQQRDPIPQASKETSTCQA